MKKLLSLLFVLCLLSACAPSTQLNTKQKSTTNKTVDGGSLVNELSSLTGHNTRSALIGAAIGSAIGGLAGYGIGTRSKNKKKVSKSNNINTRHSNSTRKIKL